MSSFEEQYYEYEGFWEEGVLDNPVNQERIHLTAGLIPKEVASLTDIGCGNGIFINYLLKAKPEIKTLAVDRSRTALKYVQGETVIASIDELPMEDNSFDCVTCLEVIEHLPVPIFDKSLSELCRVAKQYVIISVPYKENLEESYNQCPACKSIFNYELHLRNFDDHRITTLLDNCGFKCIQTHKLGESVNFKAHYNFRKLFYGEQFKQWRSPICPVCGYAEATEPNNGIEKPDKLQTQPAGSYRKFISYLTFLPKFFWPKEKKHYWIIAVYKKA